MGCAVGLNVALESTSTMYSASPDGSLVASLDHGVIWFSLLFRDQVHIAPLSVTRLPSSGLAITLHQGVGVVRWVSRVMAYSRPSAANPPSPLKNSRVVAVLVGASVEKPSTYRAGR
jgi:hypothetical protein